MKYYRLTIAWIFISFCPVITGLAWTILFHNYTGVDAGYIFIIQSIIWGLLYCSWFEDSKYQKAF